jgi:dephospho-CoA kinase
MGSGKSEIAKYLRDNYNYTIKSLGEKIHNECRLHGNETREEMQQYGQMMRKVFGENVWCDYLYNKTIPTTDIVIDDARQINEFDYFTKRNFIPIGIITDKEIRLERLKKRVNYEVNPNTFEHETEIQAQECIDKCNILISNNGDLKSLYKQIENKIIRSLYE